MQKGIVLLLALAACAVKPNPHSPIDTPALRVSEHVAREWATLYRYWTSTEWATCLQGMVDSTGRVHVVQQSLARIHHAESDAVWFSCGKYTDTSRVVGFAHSHPSHSAAICRLSRADLARAFGFQLPPYSVAVAVCDGAVAFSRYTDHGAVQYRHKLPQPEEPL